MPAVIDAPAVVTCEAHALYEEQPHARIAHPGFWHTLVQYIVRPQTKRSPRTLRFCAMTRPQKMETPVELWARQYPHLYLQAFAGQ